MMDWKKESEMFDQSAEYYDKYRPSYPKKIVDKIIEVSGIKSESKLLEIGAGSGKATALFAPYNFSIHCIDPGANLVKNGRIRFSEYKKIKFEIARFEELSLQENYYDLIFSAQSFHWIPQPIGYEKCAYSLKDNGYLALFWNMYITYNNNTDNELLEISNKHGGFADFLSEDECEKRISKISKDISNSSFFRTPLIHRVLWNKKYTAEEYIGFVQTGNRFIQKTDKEKQCAYTDIKRLADKHEGIIDRPYLCVLYLAQNMKQK